MQQQAGQQVGRVVIGMDPHKRSATIEVMTADETIIGGDRFATDGAGFAAMVRYVKEIRPDVEDRVWAVEGCKGIGHHIASRLLAESEHVSMCHRSCRRGCGSSRPVRAARPTQPTPTP